ncbi:pentapeptide repeat-containing protein [Aliisedimentitalea scapharcae]|uniref:Pentapeptide repeat-containing protein n=1 Tax=Aliisedimentitalea scapharcae TaxID=1524259 RepID=A0ABZ2XX66_9RHOB
MTELPIEPELFWGLVWAVDLFLSVFLIFGAFPSGTHHIAQLERFQKRLNLDQVNPGLFLIGILLWGAIFGLLFIGLVGLIWDLLWSQWSQDPKAIWNWRFALAKLTALTAVLGAIVAFPKTLIRLGLTQKQTEIAQASLFNEKINATSDGLHARRQVWKGRQTRWEDDVASRNFALSRLRSLAEEQPNAARQISRLLNIYVRELSKECSPVLFPTSNNSKELDDLSKSVCVSRSDMETAVQVLGTLKRIEEVDPKSVEIDLQKVNLQKFYLTGSNLTGANLSDTQMQWADLSSVDFSGALLYEAQMQQADLFGAVLQNAFLFKASMQGSNLFGAQIHGADLTQARLQGVNFSWAQMDEGTDFRNAILRGASFRDVDCSKVNLSQSQIDSVFYDGSVKLANHLKRKEGWDLVLSAEKFRDQKNAWQKSIGFDPNDPST